MARAWRSAGTVDGLFPFLDPCDARRRRSPDRPQRRAEAAHGRHRRARGHAGPLPLRLSVRAPVPRRRVGANRNTVELMVGLRGVRGPSTAADQAPDSKSTVLGLTGERPPRPDEGFAGFLLLGAVSQ